MVNFVYCVGLKQSAKNNVLHTKLVLLTARFQSIVIFFKNHRTLFEYSFFFLYLVANICVEDISQTFALLSCYGSVLR